MHRSGTSALTRVLGLLGATLPKSLIQPDENNTAGYWEPLSLNSLNDEVLVSLGSRWNDWRDLDLGALGKGALTELEQKVRTLLAAEYGNAELIVLKEPRIGRLFEVYREALHSLGWRVTCVLPFRNPGAVADSLRARDGMPRSYGLLLWLRYVTDTESVSRGLPRIFTSFEGLMNGWRTIADRIANDLNIAWPSPPSAVAQDVAGFLQPSLVHNEATVDALDASTSEWVSSAYRALIELERDPSDPGALKTLDELRRKFHSASALIGPATTYEVEKSNTKFVHQLEAAAQREDALRHEADQQGRQRAQIEAALASSQSELAAAEQRRASLTVSLEENLAKLEKKGLDLERMRELLSLQDGRFRTLSAEVELLKEGAKTDEQALRAAQGRSATLEQTLVAREAELAERKAALDAADSQQRVLSLQLAEAESAIVTLKSHLGHTAQRLAAKEADLQALEKQTQKWIEEHRAEMAQLAGRATEAEQEVAKLRRAQQADSAQLAEIKSQSAKLLGDYQKEREDLHTVIGARDADLEVLRANVRKLTEDFMQVQADAQSAWQKVQEAHVTNVVLKANVEQMRRSIGWRLFAPWRAARSTAGQLALFRQTALALEPLQQIEPAETGNATEWRMTGEDPHFELSWPSRASLPHGYYILTFSLPGGASALVQPKLYIDAGRGYNEDDAVLLHLTGEGSHFAARFALREGARRLRLDPSVRPGRFVLNSIYIKRVSRFVHYSSLLAQVVAYRRSVDGSLRAALAATWRTLRLKGLRGTAATLRAYAQRIAELPPETQRHLIAETPQYVPITDQPLLDDPPVRVICFYLPQFHPIPENDAWWGKGFTEWSNVRPATPQFAGHYQPHEPDMLGYYDLRDSAVQRRQVELAKLYGIGGFCFYFYWFAGKLLLETPTQNYLADKTLDLPFCLCWANENWSRRWDGLDSEVLIGQAHSPEDDLAFIAHISKYLADPRYIRIGGRPLVLVYRPSLLPDASETAGRWRQWCRENGIGEIYLAYTQSFEMQDPSIYGFDAAVEFPPNNSSPPSLDDVVVPLRDDFGGKVFDWTIFPERSRDYQDPGYKLFRGVNPGWDNTARRKNGGTIFANSTPSLYGQWLGNAITDTRLRFSEPDERLVFVNAWNEWAEGAHLEPDQRYGFAYLDATRKALVSARQAGQRIVLVSHDAHPHGAQLLVLHMARHLSVMGFRVDLVVLEDGPLLDRFAEHATVHRADLSRPEQVAAQATALWRAGAEIAFVNTAVSGGMVPILKQAGFVVVSLIHELPGVLASYKLESQAAAIADDADKVVFAAEAVRAGFESFIGHELSNAVIRPQGTYFPSPYRFAQDSQLVRRQARQALGLPVDKKIILSAGYADHRKGFDIFIDTMTALARRSDDVIGVWIGHHDAPFVGTHLKRLRSAGFADRLILPGRVEAPQDYYAAADLYALTSREDPFPTVVMEALDAKVPVVAFEGVGGFEGLLHRGCGLLVPAFDVTAYAAALQKLLDAPDAAAQMAATGHDIVVREFGFRHYLFDLLELAGRPLPRVSVVVPNFNYARYIVGRLQSIVDQSLSAYELIVLDDASTDDSAALIADFLADCPIPAQLVVNEKNSGSVFRQWAKGVALARGEYVWIAEADDLSNPDFLATALEDLEAEPEAVMSYTQSRMIDGEGKETAPDYLDYVSDLGAERWRAPYLADGAEEVARGLFLKNTVPNVSGAVFRREALAAVLDAHLDEIASYRNAGDWLVYLRLMEKGRMAFSPKALNLHRRHTGSVTLGNANLRHLKEIIAVQREAITRFGLGPEAEARARDYAQRIYEQFGLATAEHPRVEMHPELKQD
jgi:glycosyltransferase involved in cell wall biosynthesis/phage host-nuclease inhibitor protein Gam